MVEIAGDDAGAGDHSATTRAPAMKDENCTFHHATLLREDGVTLTFELEGKQVGVGTLAIQAGTTACYIGVPGTLVIPRGLAINLRLVHRTAGGSI
jgi:hypothetical protein